MIATDFTLAGMLICLGISVAIIVYGAAIKGVLNDGNHQLLWRILIGSLVIGLLTGAMHVWLATR
ncbi:hypothetical protein [Arthrobacter sp. B0490]|uniref:hypothetical protein n=1 Tax=Arthrobacter sp. B0490 TaxID=2058891 RepID=UPI0011AFD3E4|nr:hypothetical protein [Arthrobacter sp. B0490]